MTFKNEYKYFNSYLDEIIYTTLLKPNDKFIIIDKDYPRVLNTYSSILLELDEYNRAKNYLKLAGNLNPLNIPIILNQVRICDYETNPQEIKRLLEKALKIVHDKDYLFMIYKSLADYYKQICEIEVSKELFKLGNGNIDVDKNLLSSYNVQLGFNPEILSIMLYASDLADKKGDFSESYLIYQDYYELKEFNEKLNKKL